MQSGAMVFNQLNRVIFGKEAAASIVAEADLLGAQRVFALVSRTLATQTDELDKIKTALGDRFVGFHDHMPSHSPRDAVVACANAARDAGCDLLLTLGGGSATDGGKAVTLCLEYDISDVDGLEPFRTVVEDGVRRFPEYRAPTVKQITVPTTLSAGEFNARAGVTDTRTQLKQSYVHPALVPETIILDPAVTVHTPEWLWLSSGVRAIDHAVETLCSLDANDYTDGTSLQALRSLSEGLARVKADPGDLEGGSEGGERGEGRLAHALAGADDEQSFRSAHDAESSARRVRARRMDRATMVKVGFAQPLVGKTDAPATYRFSTPCSRRSGSA